MLLLEILWYLILETRLNSVLFNQWATRPAASASKRVLARRCSVQDSRIRSYFFAMLAVVHRELTDCSCKWFRKGARKCSHWSFLLDIVQKAFFNSKYRHSSFNAVLLYRGIPSTAVFTRSKTALKFHLTRFF